MYSNSLLENRERKETEREVKIINATHDPLHVYLQTYGWMDFEEVLHDSTGKSSEQNSSVVESPK